MSGVLQGLVKICKKYMEINRSSLPSCSNRRQCIVFLCLLVGLFGKNLVDWGNYFRGKFYGNGKIFLWGNRPRENFLGTISCGAIIQGVNVQGNYLGGNCPRTLKITCEKPQF